MGSRDLPPCPPIVRLTSGGAGHLLAWRKHERTGQWWAWVSWIQETSGGYVHHIVEVRADTITPLEPPQAYRDVPRQLLGTDGQNRRWRPDGRLALITGRPQAVAPGLLWPAHP
jgi:hypothetical protein